MATILDNLIENIQLQIAQGNTHASVDKDVLADLFTEYDTPEIIMPASLTAVPENPVVNVDAVPATIQTPAAPVPTTQVTPVVETPKPIVTEAAPTPIVETPTAPVVSTPAPPLPPVAPAAIQQAVKDLSGLSLDELRHQGNTCSSCKLTIGEQRSENIALNTSAKIMVITEPAGTAQEFLADPFAGEAGNLLKKMISALNVSIDDIYLCMAHRCFGPGAREAIRQTRPYLEKQIELVNPEVIVIFGGAAVNILLNEQSLVKCRGRWLEIGNVPAIATYPPGYLMKKATAKREAWNDLQQVIARLKL